MDALAFLLEHFSREGNELFITGANLHIVNGLGATNGNPAFPSAIDPAVTMTNGLGNLIIGYNELRGNVSDERPGSHNLVVGRQNSFSSFGGLVAGRLNSALGPYSTVSGGQQNTAGGPSSSVSGGAGNLATGLAASVSGGVSNTASAQQSSVSGGQQNTASGVNSSVSGGLTRSAPGTHDWRAGGLFQDL